MSRTLRISRLGAACAALLVLMLIGSTVAIAKQDPKELLTGLSSPKGLTLDVHGNPVVGQGAFGPAGPVLKYKLRGPHRGDTVELTDDVNVVDIAFGSDGGGYAIGGDAHLYRVQPDGSVLDILDVPAYQAEDPDPVDQDYFAEESNPYGLAVLPEGDALLTDAANNDLLRVTAEGAATTVARFDLEEISTDHLGDDNLPPTLTAEAVPTTVAVGPGGFAYVGELKGYPFRPRSSHIWKVDPDLEGAWCSVNEPNADCTIYAKGLTAIQDIAFNHRNHKLFVYELAAKGVLAFEEGFSSGDFPPAVLLRIRHGERTRLAVGQLSQPGGVTVGRHGAVFVTDGMFTDGRLLRVRG